jgi:hypothetical protein
MGDTTRRADNDQLDSSKQGAGDTQRAADVSGEVGHEGGTPGDLELTKNDAPTTGSEATELVEGRKQRTDEIRRDETGVGRRSPIG